MASIQENIAESKSILDKESAIKKLKDEGVDDIKRLDDGVIATVFISDSFLSQFADFIEFQNYVGSK